jgi:hypothetical protein
MAKKKKLILVNPKPGKKTEKLVITADQLMKILRKVRRELEPITLTHRVHKTSKKDKKRDNKVKDFD